MTHSLIEEFPDLVALDDSGSPFFVPNGDTREIAIQEALTISHHITGDHGLANSARLFFRTIASTLMDPNPYAEIHSKCLAYKALYPDWKTRAKVWR